MSVNLMSAIFEVEFFDLQDGAGNITKASTAKLVLLAMADHANDEGEGSYPSIEKLCRKTALSAQTIRNTFDALRYNGIIELAGKSKYGTNNHTINTKSFPKAIGKEVTVLTLYPLEGSNGYLKGSNQSPDPILPIRPESLTKEPSNGLKTDEEQPHYSTAYNRGEQERPDKVGIILDLEKNSVGAQKMYKADALLSRWSVAFLIKTTSKDWRKFAEYAVEMQVQNGWEPDKFIEWVKRQDGYPTYWSRKRMEENYPKAFLQEDEPKDWQDRSHPL